MAVAHRRELVTQMSLALAREGVRHRVIGPDSVRRACVQGHMDEIGRSYFDPNSKCAVAGVDTLVTHPKDDPWLKQVQLWVMDEAHHVLEENKWGRSTAMFPNARGLGVTATPVRADGKGLGANADGVFNAMVLGPSMRDLIGMGCLADYRIVCPPVKIDLSNVHVTASGDFSPSELREARHKSSVTGDVVAHYLKFAKGKRGVTFEVDVESAVETATAFKAAGVPAEVLSAKTPDMLRALIMRRFRAGEILQIVNVDLLGEGLDVPAIEVVSMARPTESFSLYAQQFGRALRIMAGKEYALILDHVGNVMRHRPPDAKRTWTLDRRERRGSNGPSDAIPIRVCDNPECNTPYERVLLACPNCGHEPVPAARSTPAQVDGDLQELDPAVLAALRGEIEDVNEPIKVPYGLGGAAAGGYVKQKGLKKDAQRDLQYKMAVWGGWQASLGRSVREAQKRFFFRFGMDVLSAMALNAKEAEKLYVEICDDLDENGVIDA